MSSSPPKDSNMPSLSRGGSLGMAEAFGRPEGDNNGGEVLPDRPSMRAMAIMNQGPSLISAGPIPGGKNSFGLSKPPPLGIARPKAGLSSRPKSEGFGVGLKQEIFALAPSSVWEVKHDELDDVPEFCLERTHRVIPDTTATIVANRIAEVLRVNSIDAEYDCKTAKAKCQTCDYVCFRIRLYAGDDSLQPRPVVVEVQRRSGSASSFMRTCRAILIAAEGKNAGAAEPKRAAPGPGFGASRGGSMLPPPLKPIGQMSFMKSVPDAKKPVDVEGESSVALEKSREMIRSDQRDTNILGMENLAALTDPIKTNPLVAMKVSKCLVLGQDGHDMREEIRLVLEHDVFAVDAEEGMKNHADQLRSIALSVFSNALELCQKNGCLASMTADKWFQESLLPTLVDQVHRCSESSACDAHEAACCIRSLLTASPTTVEQSIRSSGGVEALQQAHEFGTQRHELLANETRRCLNLLNV